jgi:succinyl-diaminopimelate desuccinylase
LAVNGGMRYHFSALRAGTLVIELGPLNKSIHKINENVVVADLDILSSIYEQILVSLLVA